MTGKTNRELREWSDEELAGILGVVETPGRVFSSEEVRLIVRVARELERRGLDAHGHPAGPQP